MEKFLQTIKKIWQNLQIMIAPNLPMFPQMIAYQCKVQKTYVPLDNASTSSSRSSRVSARQAKVRELELAAKLRALHQKRELEERRRR